MTSYADRGKADFDTALQALNHYGTWSKIDGKWAYTPLDHLAPYTHGRWIYTEYGWYWKSARPHGWVTEHYGYWKRSAENVWSWYPGPYWLPEIVELRATDTSIGWRSAAVDQDGNFVEPPAARYAKNEEWTFVTRAQFAGPVTPDIIAKPDAVKSLLDDSTECRHTYLTYRVIDRPGPHPADIAALGKNTGMLAPETLEDEAAKMAPPPKPKPVADSPAAHMTGTNAPALLGAPPDDATVDTRKVKYWITMSLPTYWAKPPTDAKPEEIYLYRPDFFQDDDGISRRITLWFNPKSRASLQDILAGTPASGASGPGSKATPAVPAVPVTSSTSDAPAKAHDPFRSPFDDSFHPSSSTARSAGATSKVPSSPAPEPQPGAGNAPATLPPTNTAPTTAPVPLPVTNAAPVDHGLARIRRAKILSS